MNTVEQLTQEVEFAPDFDAERLFFDRELGFLALAGEGTRLAAFHATEETGDTLTPALTRAQRGSGHDALNDNAKGVGIVLGNTHTSVTNTHGRTLGLWLTPELADDEILDLSSRNPQNPMVMAQGILRHAGLLVRARRWGVNAALQTVERPYGDHGLVVINPAPKVLLNQRQQGIVHSLPPRWAVYRDAQRRPLQRIGTVPQ